MRGAYRWHDGMDDDCASMSKAGIMEVTGAVWPLWFWLDLVFSALGLPQVLVSHSRSRPIWL